MFANLPDRSARNAGRFNVTADTLFFSPIGLATVLFLIIVFSGSSSTAQGQGLGEVGRSENDQKAGIAGTLPVVATAPTANKTVGSTFVVPITVGDITGDGIFAFQFNILYNPAVIDPSGSNFGCSTSGTLAGAAGLSPTCNVLPDGTLRVSVSGVSAMTGSGTILNLTFTTDPSAIAGNVSPLTFSSTFFFNAGGAVASSTVNGQITLISPPPTAAGASVSGSVVGPGGRPVSSVRVTLTDNAGVVRYAITNPFGFYAFDDVPTGSVYLVNATSKRFTFQQRVITLLDDLAGIDLVAEP